MEFSKIISISGKPGLFEILTQTKTGVIVESLVDQKRTHVKASQDVTMLENIAIYTYEEEVALSKIFISLAEKNNNAETISHKEDAKKLTEFFAEVLPDYDVDRVYTSNIKKVIQWYNILAKASFDFASLQEKLEEQKA